MPGREMLERNCPSNGFSWDIISCTTSRDNHSAFIINQFRSTTVGWDKKPSIAIALTVILIKIPCITIKSNQLIAFFGEHIQITPCGINRIRIDKREHPLPLRVVKVKCNRLCSSRVRDLASNGQFCCNSRNIVKQISFTGLNRRDQFRCRSISRNQKPS